MLLLDASIAGKLVATGTLALRAPVGLGYTLAEEGVFLLGEERILAADLLACHPRGSVGALVPVSAREPFGKSRALGSFSIAALSLQFLDDISDEQIAAEGCANWSEYAFRWNQLNPKSPWDLNPLCWVAELSSR